MNLAQLLFRGESESLDFKRDQYPFYEEDDRVKSEIVKDVLAMANSWRSETGYILVGVDGNNGFPRAVGITKHIDDAHLQRS